MSNEILTALIGFAGTILVAVISYLGSAAGTRRAARENIEIVRYRLQELEKKVDKHNHLVERMTQAEGRLSALEAAQRRGG